MVVGEFFTQGPRSAIISIAVLVNWSANVIVGQTFPLLFSSVTKDWTFILFSGLLLVFIVFTYAFMPETKGKTPEEMANYFKNNKFAFRQPRALLDSEENIDDDKRKEIEGSATRF
jgi:hypothetical protein